MENKMSFDRTETYDKVVGIVTQKLSTDTEVVKKAISFESLGADSLDMVEIIMQLEEEFGTEIKDEDAESLITIDQVVDYIQKRRTK